MFYSVLTSNERDNVRSAPSFSSVFLIPQLIKVLLKVEKNITLTQYDKKILSQGQTLVKKIIEGVRIIENNDVKKLSFPIKEGMSTYGYALDTLGYLRWYEEADKSEEFFNNLRSQLETLERLETKGVSLPTMKRFFEALGDSFMGELNKGEYPAPEKFPAFEAV